MTRILWQLIKDELLLPFIDLKTEYYDLGLEYRNETDDPFFPQPDDVVIFRFKLLQQVAGTFGEPFLAFVAPIPSLLLP